MSEPEDIRSDDHELAMLRYLMRPRNLDEMSDEELLEWSERPENDDYL
jgi:hypothetical protein